MRSRKKKENRFPRLGGLPQFSSSFLSSMGGCAAGPLRTARERLIFPAGFTKTQEDAMRYTKEEMKIMNEYETLRNQESEILDCLEIMELSIAERNALEYSLELASEDMVSLRGEYL